MKKIKKILKSNIKLVIGLVIGTILTGTTVYASSVLLSENIPYSNISSGLTSTNVQEAIDEIYDKTFVKKKIEAYVYSETGSNKCINGEEKTCQKTTCYENKAAGSCKQGTIIKYYVNDNEQKVFYVLHDDGATITMQQRENTVRNIPWYVSANNNSYGPTTILPYLEAATATWTNVNFQEYTAGYTNFYQNAYTGCSVTSDYKVTCNVNTYNSNSSSLTLAKRKVKARMITAQEASSTGCLVSASDGTNNYNQGTCPDWMHNYLYKSKSYGGSYEDNTLNENEISSNDYWTMSANSSNSSTAWFISLAGYLDNNGYSSSSITAGARAVVVISK